MYLNQNKFKAKFLKKKYLSSNHSIMASLVAQMVKNLSAMWKTWVQSLGWEDPVEEGIVTHSVFLPGESPRTEEPGRLQSMGLQRVGRD